MAQAAASAHPDARRPEPLVNIVVDHDTFTQHLVRATGGPAPQWAPRPGAVCRLGDGTPLDPASAVAAALAGAVRRVVLDSAGIVVEAGTTRRLFTGPVREVLLTQVTECTWPGCHIRVRHCQIDHITEWNNGGRTDPANANPLCGKHNHPRNPPTATASTATPTAPGTPTDPTAPKSGDQPRPPPGKLRACSVGRSPVAPGSCPDRSGRRTREIPAVRDIGRGPVASS